MDVNKLICKSDGLVLEQYAWDTTESKDSCDCNANAPFGGLSLFHDQNAIDVQIFIR